MEGLIRINGLGYEVKISLDESCHTEFERNAAGHVVVRNDFKDGEIVYWEAFVYADDNPNLLIAYGNSNNYEVRRFYDEHYNLVKITTSTGKETIFTYYDKDIIGCGGKIKTISSNDGTSTFYSYTPCGDIDVEENIAGSVCRRTVFTYDENANVIKRDIEVLKLADFTTN